MKMKLKKGFTLVEIMIVVAIIAILAAVAIPNFIKYRKTSQATACVSNLKQIQGAKEQFLLAGNAAGEGGITLANLCGNDKYLKVTPTCPANGTYAVGADGTDPSCTIGKTLDDDDKAMWHVLDKTVTTTP